MDVAKTVEFNAHRIGGVPAIMRARSARGASANARSAENVVVAGAPGQTGLQIDATAAATYYGLYAGHSGWYASEFNYSQPYQLLYAPTGRPPNSCIEVGTAYRPGSSSLPEVFAYDFCDPNAPFSDSPANTTRIGSYTPISTIDSSFRTNFERDFGDGVPTYSMEIAKNPGGTWTLYLYNWTAGLWLPYYTSRGTTYDNGFQQPTQGWDLFEPKYPSGACISTPQIEAGGMQLYNAFSRQWVVMTSVSQAQLGPSVDGDCIGHDDGSAVGFFYEFFPQTTANWSVYSYQSFTPPPGGGETGCNPLRDCCYSLDVNSCCEPFSCCSGFGACCSGFDSDCCYGMSYSHDSCTLSSRRRVDGVLRQTSAAASRVPFTGTASSPSNRRPGR